jgi:DNA-binding FrmR family transcriptional regulator
MPAEKEAVLQWMRTAEDRLITVSQLLEEDHPCQQILDQLNAVQCAVEAAGSTLLRMEIERCLQGIRDNPCPEQRCEQLARLVYLYPLANKFKVKFYEMLPR